MLFGGMDKKLVRLDNPFFSFIEATSLRAQKEKMSKEGCLELKSLTNLVLQIEQERPSFTPSPPLSS